MELEDKSCKHALQSLVAHVVFYISFSTFGVILGTEVNQRTNGPVR